MTERFKTSVTTPSALVPFKGLALLFSSTFTSSPSRAKAVLPLGIKTSGSSESTVTKPKPFALARKIPTSSAFTSASVTFPFFVNSSSPSPSRAAKVLTNSLKSEALVRSSSIASSSTA